MVGTKIREIHIYLDEDPPLIQFDVIAPSGIISETDIKVIENSLSKKLK